MKHDRDELERSFRELKDFDRALTPPFPDLTRSPDQLPKGPAKSRSRGLLLALTAAAGLVLMIHRSRSLPQPEASFDELCAAALAALGADSEGGLLPMSTDELLPFDSLSDR